MHLNDDPPPRPPRLPLTDGLRQPVDSLAVGVGFVPDVGVGQVGLRWEPLLEQSSHHGDHEVNLEEQRG